MRRQCDDGQGSGDAGFAGDRAGAKNSGGIVLLQVEKVVQNGTLDARKVKIPGIYVDGIVVSRPENHWQTYEAHYNPALCGEVKVPVDSIPPMKLNERKIICRRAAMELDPQAIINLGIGMPEGIANVANEEGLPGLKLTVETGGIGGVPMAGTAFGTCTNPTAILDQPYQFDFYDGGGLDQAFLGLAECDRLRQHQRLSFRTEDRRLRRIHQHHADGTGGGVLRNVHGRRAEGGSEGTESCRSCRKERSRSSSGMWNR